MDLKTVSSSLCNLYFHSVIHLQADRLSQHLRDQTRLTGENVIFGSYIHTLMRFKASASLGCTKKKEKRKEKCATACISFGCQIFLQSKYSLVVQIKCWFFFFLNSIPSVIYPRQTVLWKDLVCPVSPSGLMWLLRISITSFTQLTAIGLCVNVCSCEWLSEYVYIVKK